MLSRIFTTIRGEGIRARMVSVGASRINVSLLVDQADEHRATRSLHREFFGTEGEFFGTEPPADA